MNPEVITGPAITGLILMLIILVLYATEVIPLAVTAIIGSPLLIWFQDCTWAKCNSGYNSDSTWMVFAMCMIGACVFDVFSPVLTQKLMTCRWNIARGTGDSPR